jgi:amino acid adenylation domain-containing protein
MGLESALDTIDLSFQSTVSSLTSGIRERIIYEQFNQQGQSVLHLPSDRLKTPTTGYCAQQYEFAFSKELNTVLKGYAEYTQIDTKTLLLAGLSALLYRYTQQETIPFQVKFIQHQFQSISTTEVCIQINGAVCGDQLWTMVSSALSQTHEIANRQAGLPSVKRLGCDRDLPITLYFASAEDAPLWMYPPQGEQPIPPDMYLCMVEGVAGIQGVVTYNSNLYQSDMVARLISHWQVMLAAMLKQPDVAISMLPMLTVAEEQHLLMAQPSGSEIDVATPLHQVIEVHALERPAAIAVRFRGQHLTYAQLNQRANQLAHYLIQLGVKPGVSVAVCIEPSLEIVVCLLAIFKAGGTYLPLDPTYPTERLDVILTEAQPKLLLAQASLSGKLPPNSAVCLCVDTDWAVLEPMPTDNPDIEIELNQTAYIIYTSGTTGKPKGVMVSYGNLIHYIRVAQAEFRFDASIVMPAIARFTFSITFFELLSPLVAGGQLIVLERDHILDFKRLVQTLSQATVVHASPSLLRKLLRYIQDNAIDPSQFQSLTHMSSGGDMVTPDVLEGLRRVFPSAELFVIYGCSEISCMGCFYPVPTGQRITQTRVGRPFDNVGIRLYDPQQNLVPIGVVGEIYFSGGGISQGYLSQSELTAEKFVEIGGTQFYRTGDLGRWDSAGNLEILGRSDFQVKIRGIRIELGEIETTLRQIAGVREGVIAARPLWNGELGLVAYVVLDPANTPAIAQIRHRLQSTLPDYMIPAAFVVLEALPLNLNGKLDRKALPDPTPENLAHLKPYVPPRNPWEQKLAEIWQTILGISPISIQDSFFEVGGDSLLAVNLMMAIEKEFTKTLPLSTLLTEPTIEQLAVLLSQAGQLDNRESLVLIREGGSKPPLFLVHDGEGETLLYRNLAYRLSPDHAVYGLQPYSRDGFPILHTRVLEMAEYYTEQIRKVQPEGPYLLGGLCVGGFLAFEMARLLQKQGQTIGLVALIDTADVEATVRTGLITSQRLTSFSKSLGEGQHLSPHERVLLILKKVSQKVRNVIAYEVQSKTEKVQNQIKMKLFRYCLDKGLPVPKSLQNIPVRIALKFAETEYIPQEIYPGEVALFLATEKSSAFDGTLIDDTPYADIYSEPLLGWEKRTTEGVRVYKVPGGHSSMLQEPNVQDLAEKMQAYIDAAIARLSTSE